MKYWVLKGRPAENDWDEMLRPGEVRKWRTKKPPSTWQASDRFFCWQSSPRLRIVGLAELTDPEAGTSDSGEAFKLETSHRCPGIVPHDRRTAEHSRYRRGVLPVIWDDIDVNGFGMIIPDIELRTAGIEGRKKLVSHFVRERDQQLIEAKKRAALKAFGRLSRNLLV